MRTVLSPATSKISVGYPVVITRLSSAAKVVITFED